MSFLPKYTEYFFICFINREKKRKIHVKSLLNTDRNHKDKGLNIRYKHKQQTVEQSYKHRHQTVNQNYF